MEVGESETHKSGSESPAKSPIKKSRQKGRGSKSQVESKDSDSTVQNKPSSRNVFERLTSQKDSMTGLSILSEAASLSLQEMKGKDESQHDKTELDEQRPSFLSEHAYFAMPSREEEDERDSVATLSAEEDNVEDILKGHRNVWIDHNYCMTPSPQVLAEMQKEYERTLELAKAIEKQTRDQQREITNTGKTSKTTAAGVEKGLKKGRKRKNTEEALADITNKSAAVNNKVSRELANLLEPVKPKEIVKFKARTFEEERQVFYNIFKEGIDSEDVVYLKKCYERLLQSDDPMFYWLNDILWVDHPVTNIPDPVPSKRRRKDQDVVTTRHQTGSSNFFLQR